MSKKRYRPEEIIGKLQEADVMIGQGKILAGQMTHGRDVG